MAVGFGALWVPASTDGTVARVSFADAAVVASIRVEPRHGQDVVSPFSVAVDHARGLVWAAVRSNPGLVAIHRESDMVARSIALDVAPYAAAAADDALWVTAREADLVMRLNPESGEVLGEWEIASPTGIAWSDGAAWVAATGDQALVRIDRRGQADEMAEIGADTQTVIAAHGAIWTADGGTGQVTRVTIGSGATASTPTASGTWTIAAADDQVWAGGYRSRLLYRLDPGSGALISTARLPGPANSVAVGGGAVWVGSWAAGEVYQLVPSNAR